MIKAVILDDEQPAIDKLEKQLKTSGQVEVVGKFTEPLVALEFLKETIVDAIFLDIEMPNLSGLEVSNRALDINKRVAVVFITAYNQYAVEAFRLNALDYLLKPVSMERLQETLKRIVEEKGITIEPATTSIQCFGKLKLVVGGSEVRFRTKKAEELLALLLDRTGKFIHRNEICDLLWEDYDGDRALTNFNTTLHYVKKALWQQGARITVEHHKGSYRLVTDGLDCDCLQFRQFTGKPYDINEDNLPRYEATADLYQGQYLVGEDYSWAELNRQMMKEKYLSLVLAIAEYEKSADRPEKAVVWLEKGLLQEQLHRELNYALIDCFIRLNDRAAAQSYYELYQGGLRRKFGEDPDDGIRDLLS